MPNKDDLFDGMRENRNGAYTWFCDKVLGDIVGKKKWPQMKHQSMVSVHASVSDEAYALFLLDNNWDFWMEQHEIKKNNGNPKEGKKKPKFTKGDNHSTKKFGGVNKEGVMRFNDLNQKVKVDRKRRIAFGFEQGFMLAKKEERLKLVQQQENEKEGSGHGTSKTIDSNPEDEEFIDELEDDEFDKIQITPMVEDAERILIMEGKLSPRKDGETCQGRSIEEDVQKESNNDDEVSTTDESSSDSETESDDDEEDGQMEKSMRRNEKQRRKQQRLEQKKTSKEEEEEEEEEEMEVPDGLGIVVAGY